MIIRNFHLKRVYDNPDSTDGTRILIDRLWPRGLRKADAAIDFWLQDVAPTPALRRWFNHEPSRFELFAERYKLELSVNPEPIEQLRKLSEKGAVTLLYGARDANINHAVVLRQFLVR